MNDKTGAELAAVKDLCKEYGFTYALSILDNEPKNPRLVCGSCRYCDVGRVCSCRFNPPGSDGFPEVSIGSWCRQHSLISINERLAEDSYFSEADRQDIARVYGVHPGRIVRKDDWSGFVLLEEKEESNG